mmetsp:Transcript_6098/g.8442  ORF Transcript_6098/g.8442 Transcript_6098/m.8442 type:complete len:371 (-) Transcript_6098:151-1263(-)
MISRSSNSDDNNAIDSKTTRDNLVLQLKDGFATSKTEEEKCFDLEGWISIDCKGAVTGQMSSRHRQKISRYLSIVTGHFTSSAQHSVAPKGQLELNVKNERFGDIRLRGALSVGQQSLQLELVKTTTSSRVEALRTVVAHIMRRGGDRSTDEYECQGKLIANCADWTFSHIEYDGPRYYRSVFKSVHQSELPVSLVGLVSSYLIPGFKMPTKSVHISQPDFTPADLPVCLKLSQGKSTHLTTGQVFWEMFGELHVGIDLTVNGFVNHSKPVMRVDHYANGITFRNVIKGCWNRTAGQFMLHANCSAFGEQHLWGNFRMGDRTVAFALLQNLTEGTDWQWDFDKVDYERKGPEAHDNNHGALSKGEALSGQ